MKEQSVKQDEKAHQNNSKIVVWNMEGKNVGITWRERPKQGLTSAKGLTMELRGTRIPLPEIRLTNLTFAKFMDLAGTIMISLLVLTLHIFANK